MDGGVGVALKQDVTFERPSLNDGLFKKRNKADIN